jgi:lipopolysaccharide transport system ATP-binding protein
MALNTVNGAVHKLMPRVIKAKNLSKQYCLGNGLGYVTLRERMVEVAQKPFTRFRNGNGSAAIETPSTIWALKEVTFEVEPGEVIGVIGRNGSGKSTLLKILSRIVEPTSGFAEIYGRSASLLEIGTGFHPELSGRENVYLNGAILGMSRSEIKQRFDEIVAFAEVEQFMNTPVKRYSTGMYLRLAFAVAAHLRTEILFLDEVLAVGDAEFQRKCLGKVQGVAQEGRTVIFVSHNLGAVTQLCQRVLWLNEGHLEFDGNARDAVSAYCSQWRQATHSWQRTLEENGDESTREILLRSVRLSQPGHEDNSILTFDLPFTAEIEYQLKKPIVDLRIVLRVVSEMGTIIFSTSDHDTPDRSREDARTEGRYMSSCKIPGNLLRPGRFFLTVGLKRHSSWFELYENLLMFEISAVGYLLPERPGVIAPVLDWDIQKLG